MQRKSALQHGLYARRLTRAEIKALNALPVLNIEGEIAYQRALINRIGQVLENNGLAADSTGLLNGDARSLVRLLNETSGRLLTFLRLHSTLKPELEELRAEIERGKQLGRQRRHVFDYLKPPEASVPSSVPETVRRKKHRRHRHRSRGMTADSAKEPGSDG